MLHIGAVQWFWDKVISLPSKQQTQALLLQSEAAEVGPHLVAWLDNPPNIVLLYTGSLRLADLAEKCEIGFTASPPPGIDAITLQQLTSAADSGTPFWDVLAEPRRQQQQRQLDERLRLSAIQLYRTKTKEQASKQRAEEAGRRTSRGANVSKRARSPEAPEEAPEREGPPSPTQSPAHEPQLTEEEWLQVVEMNPLEVATQHIGEADIDTVLRNVDDLMESEGLVALSAQHAHSLQQHTRAKAPGPKTKSVPRKKAPAPRTKSSQPPSAGETARGETTERAESSSQRQRSQAEPKPTAVSARTVLEQALGEEDPPLFDDESD